MRRITTLTITLALAAGTLTACGGGYTPRGELALYNTDEEVDDATDDITICDDGEDDCDEDGFSVEIDCDDTDPTIGAPETGEECPEVTECINEHETDPERNDCDGDGAAAFVDCDDHDATVYTNCDGEDHDADGFYTPADCDDTDADIHPGAAEVEDDGIDQDCDGVDSLSDEAEDDDGDGWDADNDCDDTDPDVNPGESEQCGNGIDDDCKAATSDVCPTVDDDGDGYDADDDCDDTDGDIYPGADELCNGVDDDCDGSVDEGASGIRWYEDLDGDGYGNPDEWKEQCDEPTPHSEWVDEAGDCDDTDSSLNTDCTTTTGGDTGTCSTSETVEDHKVTVCTDADSFRKAKVTQYKLFWLVAKPTNPESNVVSNTTPNLSPAAGGGTWYNQEYYGWRDTYVAGWDPDHCIEIPAENDDVVVVNGFVLVDGVWHHLVETSGNTFGVIYIEGGNQCFEVDGFDFDNGTDYDIHDIAYVGKASW